jgi:hypothetical protein
LKFREKLGAVRGRRKKRSPLDAKLRKKPSAVFILRFLSIALFVGMILSVFGNFVSKYTSNDSDDPIGTVESQLLGRMKIPEIGERKKEPDGLDKLLEGEVDLDALLPSPDALTDNRRLKTADLFGRENDPGFPPEGTKLGALQGKIFFENQRRYDDIGMELIRRRNAIFLSGAGMCEVVQSGYVLLKPCIFREKIVDDLDAGRSPYEMEILRSLSFFVTLPFEGYSRHITSTYGCSDLAEFRMTVQFMKRMRDGYVSLRLPYSISEVDAVEDLLENASRPCRGEDVFFEPEQLVKMLALIDLQRAYNKHGEPDVP